MIKENRFIRLSDGTKLHTQIKEVGGPVWIIMTHGLGEHLGRHNYMLGLFNNNFNIFQYDLRGHGKSEGKRAYITNFSAFVHDLDEVVSYVRTTFKAGKIALFGHSMGGLITSGYIQGLSVDEFYPQCVFLSAPCVGVTGFLGTGLRIFPKLTHQLAQLPVSVPLGRMINLHKLSHDSMVYENYIRDELNSLKIHSHLLFEILDFANKTFTLPLRARCPLACAVGSEDSIVSVGGLKEYFTQLEKGAQLFIVEGAYHEMHNEIKKFKSIYFEHLVDFLSKTFFPEEA